MSSFGSGSTRPFDDGETQSPPSIFSAGGGFGSSEAEEGLALREWRRRNAIELGEKEKKEKEKLKQIIEEAEAFKVEFYRKRELNVEKKKASNREVERVFLENQDKFHAEAERNYWKAVAEMIPREVAAIDQKRGKRAEKEKKTGSVVVIHGPKPGKPTDLSRMRQILVKLKQSPLLTGTLSQRRWLWLMLRDIGVSLSDPRLYRNIEN